MKTASRKVRFLDIKGLSLYGKIYFPRDKVSIASVFIVPGYTQLRMKRYSELQKFLAHKDVSSFVYDYKVLEEGCISKERVTLLDLIDDTKSAFLQFSQEIPNKNFFVLGYSIGSYLVPMLLNEFEEAGGIILVSPPAYSTESEKMNIGILSSEATKQQLQSVNSPIFRRLDGLKKRLLVIFGDWDQEIPPNIRRLFKDVKCDSLKCLNIPQGAHSLLRDRSPSEKIAADRLIEQIYEFIDGGSKSQHAIAVL